MILSVADAANAPPALVLNENVATLEALPATRSIDAMANVGLVTLSPIWAFVRVCNGHPLASNVDVLTLESEKASAPAFLNPAIVHTTASVGDAGAAAVDRFSSSTPEDGLKAAQTVPVDGLRLEQEGGAAVALRNVKRKPVMDMNLKAAEFRAGAATKNSINATSVVAAT